MLRLSFALPLAALLAIAGTVAVEATFPARNGLIAYSGQTDDGIQIFTMRPNGRDIRQITHVDGDAVNVDWSPDGRRIAFDIQYGDDDCQIAIVDADGSNLRKFPGVPGTCEDLPAFTPDGKSIVFGAVDEVTPDGALWIMNVDGSDRREISHGPGLAWGAEISPDGQTIAFNGWNLLEEPDSKDGLWTMGIDGSDVHFISLPIPFPKHDWSPDGQRIAVSTNGEDRTQASNVITFRPDGSDRFEVTHYVGPDQRAAVASYSPDGQWILFRLRIGNQRALFRIRPDGTDQHQLTPWSEFIALEADWGPAVR
jgi:Tol biopolymer transport system component